MHEPSRTVTPLDRFCRRESNDIRRQTSVRRPQGPGSPIRARLRINVRGRTAQVRRSASVSVASHLTPGLSARFFYRRVIVHRVHRAIWRLTIPTSAESIELRVVNRSALVQTGA
jgi:hypothetical protein